MTCTEFRDRVLDFLDGTLADRAGFEAHAAGCDACRELIGGIELNERVLAAARVPLAPPGLWSSIASRISEVREKPFRRTRFASGLAAAAAVVLSLGLFFSAPSRHPKEFVFQKAAPQMGLALRSLVPGYEDAETATAMVEPSFR